MSAFRTLSRVYPLVYPGLLLGGFHVTWWVARLVLGRWPRPSLDDPKSIGNWVDLFYTGTGLLLALGLPVFAGAVFFLVHQAATKPLDRTAALAVAGFSTLMMAGVIGWLRWDPMGIVDWYMD